MPTGSPVRWQLTREHAAPQPARVTQHLPRRVAYDGPRLAVLEHGRPTTSARFFCKAVENPNVNFESQR